MNDKWAGISKEVLMAYFKVLSRRSPGETGEKY
jgi:hypothetical protein